MTKTGATLVLSAGGALCANLEREILDAAAWFGPFLDLQLGLYRAAKYYYYPGWHEPGTALEIIFNKNQYNILPNELRIILEAVAAETNLWSLCRAEARNVTALDELVGRHGVKLVRYPATVLDALRSLADQVLEDEAAKGSMAKKVHEAFKKARDALGPWATVSEKAYWQDIAVKQPRGSDP
jgi:TRAP-type mannitol/chloroaromatic compound transport system substrate-binding protein